jgi:surfactin synthase thioesterase subunit
MPTVRDDLRICQSHWRTDAPPLPCPLHIVGGLDDPVAPPDTVAAWASYSVQPQPVRFYPGGHFLFRSPEPELVATVARVAKEAALERNLLP